MTFTPPTQAQIRDLLLASWAARYRALGKELATAPDTEPYQLADALAYPLEGLGLRALQLTREIFPDTASTATLVRHAALVGLTRKAATKATRTLSISGTGSYTTANRLTSADGLTWAPTASGSITGTGSVTVQCQTAGTGGNKATGTVLTWSSAPTGLASTGTVTSGGTDGTAEETDAALAQRVLAWWAERPGAGNRADVLAWAESQDGVHAAFVYPQVHPTLGPSIPGAIRVLVVGPPESRTQASPLGITTDTAAAVESYLEAQVECSVDPADVSCAMATTQYQDVTLEVIPAPGQEFGFTGTFTVDTGSTTTRVKLTTSPVGTIASGDWIAVPTGVRGSYEARQVTTVAAGYVDLSAALSAAPAAPATLRPAGPWWNDLRDAVVALFDALGPGDVDTGAHPQSARYPAPASSGPAVLYRSALVAVAMGVPGFTVGGEPVEGVSGILSASVVTPATDITPAAYSVLVPQIVIFQAP